jgi:hypothetical protein
VRTSRLGYRAGRLIAHGILLGLAVSLVYFAVTDWSLSDAEAYWNAAERIRNGEPLYPSIADPEASDVYRYAPWFAFAAVPFTFLPQWIAGVIWSAALIAASAISVAPLARERHVVAAAFFGSVLLGISAIGNVQPLVVAALMLGLERRSGPLWIAAAASLKAVPIVFALVYLGRRQWWRFGLSLVLTVLLVAPVLLFDLRNYVTSPGAAGILITWPPIYVAVGLGGAVAAIRLARGRFGWLAAAVTTVLAVPRFFVYDVTFLLPGTIPATRATPHASNEHE